MFPFLIAASLVLAIAAGSRSGWKTAADMQTAPYSGTPPQIPPVRGYGDSVKRWFLWYVDRGAVGTAVKGPLQMTDREAFVLETNSRIQDPTIDRFYRFVFSPTSKTWVYDRRESSALALGQDPYHAVGAYRDTSPLTGRWTYSNFPVQILLNGATFNKALWQWPRPGVIAQYRENAERDARHLFVMADGTFMVDHVDEANPDKGHVIEHFLNDVLLRRA